MFQDKSNKTEKPTGRRLMKAREKGQVARSKELPGALVLAAFLVFCHFAGAPWRAKLEALVAGTLSNLVRPDMTINDAVAFFTTIGLQTTGLLVLPLGTMVVAGVGGNLIQGWPTFTLKPLNPDLSKLNPITGLGKLFKLKGWIEMIKTTFKMVMFGVIALTAVRESMADGLGGSPGAEGTLLAIMILSGKVIFRITLFAFALSIADYLFTKFDYTRNLRMTKQEVKDEGKEAEGDPVVKARIRAKQMAMARSRMMADVPDATVVITNPTHFAVALRYVPGEMDVPQVLAKGRGKLAERIRGIAKEHGVPIVSDPPLARALYRAVEVGSVIPEALFRAVAEVLALVLRGGKGRRPGGRR